MSIDEYLDALEQRVKDLGAFVVSWSIQREIDTNLDIGLIKGRAEFIDGSRLEFTEQLPVERRKFRLHYMDSNHALLMRWDSAPHHRD